MRLPITITALLALTGCDAMPDRGAVPRTEARPAAALLAPGPDTDLSQQLRRVDAELAAALAGEPNRVMTAEAITDQLLHAPRDVDWLATGYSVEARLRQIQALADGIVARLRRGATLAGVEPEIRTLRASIADLSQQLALPGGGDAPPTLETLLAQDPLRDARARPPSAPAAAATAGTAVPQAGAPVPVEAPTPTPTRPTPAGTPLGRPIPDPDGR